MEVIRISELKMRPDHSALDLENEIRKQLRIKDRSFQYEIMRQSIDARKKPQILYIYTVDVRIASPKSVLKKIKGRQFSVIEKTDYHFPYQNLETETRPVIIGSGPAGLFCGLMLARAGARPIILERGEAVEQRLKTVSDFWNGGALDPQSNVQFGEGGAGTFSDGKLNTLIKDPSGRIRFILKEFIQAGADPSILYHHKPHIGTDVLVHVVKHIREEIISCGGEVRFSSCVTDLCSTDDGYELEINGGESKLTASCVIPAIGHSARDTFEKLYERGLSFLPKAFAVGFRIEHPQVWINDAMYGPDCPYEMGAAPYKLTHKCEDGRGVYSFCMCPGGYVVNASSEQGRTAVNGMSYSDRGSKNANSAIVITVTPEDYQGSEDRPLAGMYFQRTLEERAYQAGKGKIPVQRLEDFKLNKESTSLGKILPQQKGSCSPANLRTILSEELNQDLIAGIQAFGRKINGFDDPDSLLSGVESRTSSPVRMIRDETCQAAALRGIFPCGEGAGYAGGITSAAVDGVRVAEHVCEYIKIS